MPEGLFRNERLDKFSCQTPFFNSLNLVHKQMKRFDEYVVHIIDPTGSTRFEVVLCQSIIHEYEEVWHLCQRIAILKPKPTFPLCSQISS